MWEKDTNYDFRGNLKEFEYKSLRTTLKWWNYVRWLSTISFLSVGIIQMSLSGISFPLGTFMLTLLAITLLNIGYWFWIDSENQYSIFPYVHNLLDIIIFSFAIFMTGGVKSPFLWGYLIPILTSSITIGHSAGLFASVISVMGLVAVSYLSNMTIVSSFKETFQTMSVVEVDSRTLLSFACLFFLVYFISSFLANTLRKQNIDLKKLNSQLKEKNKLILASQKKLCELERRETIYQMSLTLQHELNNPLAILSLNSEMLIKENNITGKQVTSINNSVTRIQNILKKMKSLHSKTINMREALDGLKIIDINKCNLQRNDKE